MNFATLKSQVKAVAFPIGEAENLTTIHDTFITENLIDIQQYVPCYRERNTDVIGFNDTRYNCGLTVSNAPDGIIQRVYTVGEDFCFKVYHRRTTLARIRFYESTARMEVPNHTEPSQTGRETLPLGDLFPDASADSTLGRALVGYWAVEGCRLYVWPSLQSTEDLVVEWTGLKTEYADNDAIYDAKVTTAIRAGLLRDVAMYVEANAEDAARFDILYDNEKGDLYHWCRQKTEGSYADEDDLPAITNTRPATTGATVTVGSPEAIQTVFAIVGQYGLTSTGSLAVGALVNSWSPAFVVTTGGNNISAADSFSGYDSVVGARYHPYLFPYTGLFGAGSIDYNRFWPSISPADRTSASMTQAYLDFFELPNNELYYDRVEGPLHLFFIDSGSEQADGNTATSAQAEWLRIKLAASTSPFKVVVMCHPAYSSGTAYPALRWPFSTWGATLVINGLNNIYERVVVNGFTYITNGLGGQGLGSIGSITQGSAKRYAANFGAIRGIYNCDGICLEFIDVDGVLIDKICIGVNLTAPTNNNTVIIVDGGGGGPPPAPIQQFFVYTGEPNGAVSAGPLPAQCYDTVGKIVWIKDDGIASNTGWH